MKLKKLNQIENNKWNYYWENCQHPILSGWKEKEK